MHNTIIHVGPSIAMLLWASVLQILRQSLPHLQTKCDRLLYGVRCHVVETIGSGCLGVETIGAVSLGVQ